MHDDTIRIRRSTDRDGQAIRELAGLDSRRAPEGEVLLAFVGSELRAALPLNGEAALADPFQASGELIDLLRVRAGQEGSGFNGRRTRGVLAVLRPRAA